MAKKQIGWEIGQMPDKMIAMATFHGSLLKELQNNPKVYEKISNAGARLISKYFDSYVDHIARIDRYRYHHIYEFGMTGSSSGRLFKSSIKNGTISYTLTEASVPNDDGYSFSRKAFIMEAGDPITIIPKDSNFLAYDLNGETVFSKKSYVAQPGGKYVAGAFESLFNEFFKSNLPEKVLKEFGFYDTIVKGIESETSKASSRINSGDVKRSAQMAAEAAYGIAGKVDSIGNRL